MTDSERGFECLFCGSDSGRLLLRRPRANICDKCVVGAVEDIRRDANSEYVRGLIHGGGFHVSIQVLEEIRSAAQLEEPQRRGSC